MGESLGDIKERDGGGGKWVGEVVLYLQAGIKPNQ
jgi:hypothetical protein